jgi:Zn-dependent M28 family amino/carboxypeptidase
MYKPNRQIKLPTLVRQVVILPFLLVLCTSISRPATSARSDTFGGAAAMAYTRHAVSFGERPSGSEAIAALRKWIISELKPLGGQLTIDSFNGETPAGPVPMANIILRFPGTSGKAVAITGHYDTKKIPMVHFVGANDAGSSTGSLLEFAKVATGMKHRDDLYIVFFDGEEAVRAEWAGNDNTYGSRHLAAKWLADGTLGRIKALINIDMIGDKDLDIADDENSSQSLRNMVWQIAAQLGYAKYFRHDPGAIADDHKPFVDAGVNAIDIIDLDYGPNGSYWHTAQDTLDKLSVHSVQVVGNVVTELVKELEK